MGELVSGTVLGCDVVGVVPGSGEVGVADPPQAIARSTTVISNARMSASRSFGKVLYSISTTYLLYRASACGLPAVHRFSPWFKRRRDTNLVLSLALSKVEGSVEGTCPELAEGSGQAEGDVEFGFQEWGSPLSA